ILQRSLRNVSMATVAAAGAGICLQPSRLESPGPKFEARRFPDPTMAALRRRLMQARGRRGPPMPRHRRQGRRRLVRRIDQPMELAATMTRIKTKTKTTDKDNDKDNEDRRSKYWEKVDVSEKVEAKAEFATAAFCQAATAIRGSAASHAVWFEKPVASNSPSCLTLMSAPAAKAKAENGEGLIRVSHTNDTIFITGGFETGSRRQRSRTETRADTIRTVQDGGASADLLCQTPPQLPQRRQAASSTHRRRTTATWHGGVVGVEVRYGGGAGVQVDGNLDDWELRLVAEARLNRASMKLVTRQTARVLLGLGPVSRSSGRPTRRILCSSGLNSGTPAATDFSTGLGSGACTLPCDSLDGRPRLKKLLPESAENPTADLRAIAARLLRPRLSDWLVVAAALLASASDLRLPAAAQEFAEAATSRTSLTAAPACGVWDDWRRRIGRLAWTLSDGGAAGQAEAWTGQVGAVAPGAAPGARAAAAPAADAAATVSDCRAVVAEEMAAQVAVMAAQGGGDAAQVAVMAAQVAEMARLRWRRRHASEDGGGGT
uniref:Reverse transcriptase domain-containing protein n=1 Tax=Macrostomum lignano TaxID=282301 RepID=A0A1I8JQS2_9PLAT